jgi:ArsR family transcriptional regulator, arsenate/arsenite/antimonite-responsive transcriptional repressor
MNEVLLPLKALSEEIRIRIVLLLLDREACVCELMEVFGMAQSKLSHHLLMLRDAGILQDEKRGKWNYYRINTKILTPVNTELLSSISRWLSDDTIVEKDRRMLAKVNKCIVTT